MLITVVAYMMKDRLKEWGKRYLEPVCVKFGFEFPDRIVKVMTTALDAVSTASLLTHTCWLSDALLQNPVMRLHLLQNASIGSSLA